MSISYSLTPFLPSRDYILVEDQKAANTAGGTFTSGADRTRDLNTVVIDTAGIASLSSNQLTLPAGTYEFRISCPAFRATRHQAHLYNITDAAITKIGTAEYSDAASNYAVSRSHITGRMTITSSKTFEVRHRCSATASTNGFGVESNFGRTEIYTVAEFWRIRG